MFPGLLFDINNSVFYFVIPVSVTASIMIVLPKLTIKNKSSMQNIASATNDADSLLNELITEPSQPATQDTTVPPQEEKIDVSAIGGNNSELDALLAGTNLASDDTITTDQVSVTPIMTGFDENKIRDLIDQKFEPVEKDLTTFKKDLNKIKEDMKITKESVDTLTESFEGTLTDMKAFQAEISNPLNFMRKYFEALDLSNLSDPSLPLRQGVLQANLNVQNNQASNNQAQNVAAPITQVQSNPIPVMVQNHGTNPPTATSPPNPPTAIVRGSEMDNLVHGTDLGPMDSVMKPLFNGNLSVANMMAIIELVGEMFEEKGDDCIDLLVEQCKLMGLKAEDEHTIYNIIDMLKNSGMSTEESISQLYRFAKIVGLNDREADAYYARLTAHKKTGTRRDHSRSE
ncbi:MAG: hypothetical protein HZA84_02685 [Thaumarchaeota archaeon]|nr:hypothetical protein [Nitrososphaerota archaeon]